MSVAAALALPANAAATTRRSGTRALRIGRAILRLPRAPRGDLAQVERLVQRCLVHAVLARDLAQRPARRGRVLDDLRRLVVADERVERGGHGERRLGRPGRALEVGLDPLDALGREQAALGPQQLDRLEQVAGDERDADVELEVALRAREGDRGVVADD